jgi:hypothetical protein
MVAAVKQRETAAASKRGAEGGTNAKEFMVNRFQKRHPRLRPRKSEVYGSRAPVDGARSPPVWPISGLAGAVVGTYLDKAQALPLRGQHTLAGSRNAEAALCFPFNPHVNTCAGTRTRALYACQRRPSSIGTGSHVIQQFDMTYLHFTH